MKILSFCEYRHHWVEIEVEVSLIPGLPQMHLLGLADQRAKESLLKIKSALRFQGYSLPKAKQIIVNLRGGDFKKSSRGLDLAIAVAILKETSQLSLNIKDKVYVFGELGLTGQVLPFDSVMVDECWKVENLLTGVAIQKLSSSDNHIQIEQLRDLSEIKNLSSREDDGVAKVSDYFQSHQIKVAPPENEFLEELKFSVAEARLLEVVALGGHSLLLMGPRGLGKTTLAESLNHLSKEPEVKHYLHQRKYFPIKEKQFWRPFVRPHHSISHLALIGGGSDCSPGEITRAHGGILLLDEMLEFSPGCQESLREPLQNKEVHLVRGKRFETYPCDFQLIGTTNLCPCGQWLPGTKVDCHRSYKNCCQYREKLSGPLLDRFEVLYFLRPSRKDDKVISFSKIKEEVLKARRHKEELLAADTRGVVFDQNQLSESLALKMQTELNSLRRLRASIQVAKTIALLEGKKQVQDTHIEEALAYTWNPFLDLKI